MGDIMDTRYFRAVQDGQKMEVSDVLRDVYDALTEKGYNPINQLVGYIMSGDPTYITSHKSARSLIMKKSDYEGGARRDRGRTDARLRRGPSFLKDGCVHGSFLAITEQGRRRAVIALFSDFSESRQSMAF